MPADWLVHKFELPCQHVRLYDVYYSHNKLVCMTLLVQSSVSLQITDLFCKEGLGRRQPKGAWFWIVGGNKRTRSKPTKHEENMQMLHKDPRSKLGIKPRNVLLWNNSANHYAVVLLLATSSALWLTSVTSGLTRWPNVPLIVKLLC